MSGGGREGGEGVGGMWTPGRRGSLATQARMAGKEITQMSQSAMQLTMYSS